MLLCNHPGAAVVGRAARTMSRTLEELLREQGNRCAYCLRPTDAIYRRSYQRPDSPTLDHIVPRSRGGGDAKSNLVMACYECNECKGAVGDRYRPGPTVAEVVGEFDREHAELALLWLHQLRDTLDLVGRTRCPRARTRRLDRMHRRWEADLLAAEGVPRRWRTGVLEAGLGLLNLAQVACWLPRIATSC